MSLGNAPAVFVSSTCYDLGQVRADLKNFLESLGLRPFLSEYGSFPINPDVNAVENCLRVVDENADIFVLIVGDRYGSIINDDKSVTNMEYLRARAKGIPIYVFVKKSVLNNLTFWRNNKDNKDLNLSGVSDSPKLFAFVDELSSLDGIWVSSFELESEITATLRQQLAFLFMDALQLRSRVKTAGLPHDLADLKGTPLRLVIEKSPYWEFRLFAHVLAQELELIQEKRHDLKYGVVLGPGITIKEFSDLIAWASDHLNQAMRIIEATTQLLNNALQEALAPQGVAGNASLIVYVAKRIAVAYEYAIEWSIAAKRVQIDNNEFERIVPIVGSFLDGVLENIDKWSKDLVESIDATVLDAEPLAPGETPRTIDFTLKVELSNQDEFHEEFDRLRDLFIFPGNDEE